VVDVLLDDAWLARGVVAPWQIARGGCFTRHCRVLSRVLAAYHAVLCAAVHKC
jgi:hypothetical protein